MNTIKKHELTINKIIFQQDNNPKHMANSMKDWFAENELKVMDWPPQSLDLNPIENLWQQVDVELRRRPGIISGKVELWEKIEKVWEEINVETCINLIESMPRRIQEVIKAKGGYTKY